MPRRLISYPRSGVISTSISTSVSPITGRASSPGVPAPSGSTRMPPCSSPSPSSRTEQIMPLEVRPYVLRAPTVNPPGSSPPGRITTTRSPSAKFVAPQTISCGSGLPTSTRVKRIGFLKPVSSSISSTRPTTRPPLTVAPWSTTDSTSMPRLVNASSSSTAVSDGGSSTYSRSQDSDVRISSDPHAERTGEPDIALDHLAHVADAVAEHQRPLHTHAEREAGVALRVDAAGNEHPRVDHAAAAPLHP